MPLKAEERKDVYERVTTKIVADLERGVRRGFNLGPQARRARRLDLIVAQGSESDKRAIFTAASHSQRVSAFLHGLQSTQDPRLTPLPPVPEP